MGVVAYAGIPLLTDDGHALGTCCVLDFKKRKWTEDEVEILVELTKAVMTEITLKSTTVRLEKETAAKDELISIAAHELKTPMTSMKAFAQIVQQKLMKKGEYEAVEDLKKIDQQINKVNKLITHLFDNSKKENDSSTSQKISTSINTIIHEVIEEFQSSGIKQTIKLHAAADYLVIADKERIVQVVNNLISNAIKYAPDAKKIDIQIESENTYVKVGITDYGLGIDQSQKNKIFERFYRIKETPLKKVAGMGLGLYISSNIIYNHKGTIGVESEKGNGSTFFFTLPLAGKIS